MDWHVNVVAQHSLNMLTQQKKTQNLSGNSSQQWINITIEHPNIDVNRTLSITLVFHVLFLLHLSLVIAKFGNFVGCFQLKCFISYHSNQLMSQICGNVVNLRPPTKCELVSLCIEALPLWLEEEWRVLAWMWRGWLRTHFLSIQYVYGIVDADLLQFSGVD